MSSDYNRINSLCERLMASLPRNYAVDRGKSSKFAFAISRRSTETDKNPSGRVWEHVGGITYQELSMIAGTSLEDGEAIDRIRRRILYGEDTVRPASLAPNSQERQRETEEEIQRRVSLEVRRQLQEIVANMKGQKPAAEAAPPAPEPERKKPTPPTPKAKKVPVDTESMEVWTQRAKECGLKEPKPHPSDPTRVDGRWLRFYSGAYFEKMAQA